jgi:ABC-2 type transport system ATP-binding protein
MSAVPTRHRDVQTLPAPDANQPVAGDEAVRIEGLSKVYRSNWTLKTTRGLDDLNLVIRRGEVFGYLGPNGAGKTTTLKILAGLLKPTHGRAWLMGLPVEQVESRRALGFLPEQPYFYDYLTGPEYLEFVARLSGVQGRDGTRAARHWFGRVGLGERPRLVLRKYSKGMLQRLGLAAALVHDPALVILDEPMSGLDPFGRRDVRDLILEQRERGVTVMFSSHILPDVEMLCDRVAIVLNGRLERLATVGELVGAQGAAVEIRVGQTPVLEVPAGMSDCLSLSKRPGESVFTLTDDSRLQEVLSFLLHHRVSVRAVTPQRATLEELFMAAAGESAFQAPGQRRSA